jgi:GAF domain-containing protein
MIAAHRLAEVFVEVADTLVDDFDLIEFLQKLTTHTSELAQVSAAGLLLADDKGRLQLMAASDERSQMLELFQVQAEEGPCQDCFRHGSAVINADLTQASRQWPRFAPKAVASGYRSVHAFPLRLRDQVIGALNLFGLDVGRLSPEDIRAVQAIADVATIGLLQERAIHRGDLLAEQLQRALNSRIGIEQAKGALAQIHGCSVDEAFELLRTHSRRHNVRLSALAHQVTSDPDSVPELTRPTSVSSKPPAAEV